MGPPGSGKKYIARRVAANYGAHYLGIDEIIGRHIRKGTPQGKQANEYLSRNRLVPDKLLHTIMGRELDLVGNNSFILNGYPNTVKQAVYLDDQVDLDFVINLDIPDSSIVNMLKTRLVHKPSGREYNEKTNKPYTPGLDDQTSDRLVRRLQDHPKKMAKTLNRYAHQNWPVFRYYQRRFKVFNVSGRTHFILWPKVRRYMNRRLHKCPTLKFKPRRCTGLMHCREDEYCCKSW